MTVTQQKFLYAGFLAVATAVEVGKIWDIQNGTLGLIYIIGFIAVLFNRNPPGWINMRAWRLMVYLSLIMIPFHLTNTYEGTVEKIDVFLTMFLIGMCVRTLNDHREEDSGNSGNSGLHTV